MPALNMSAEDSELRTTRFGIEIETQRITRRQAIDAVGEALRLHRYVPEFTYGRGTGGVQYNPRTCSVAMHTDHGTPIDGRVWTAVYDGSLGDDAAEIVSPILTYADMDLLQDVVRELRKAGATVNSRTGIHVHVDAASLDAPSLGRLCATTYSYEGLIVKALNLNPSRQASTCGRARPMLAQKALAMKSARSLHDSASIWYGYDGPTASGEGWYRATASEVLSARRSRYHDTRYHGLNLHSTFFRGTIEFRYFDSTLHAGKVRSYVCLCIGMVLAAKNSRQASVRKTRLNCGDEKWTMYCFLYYKLGLKGSEFKNVREHLTAHLAGSLRGGNNYGIGRGALRLPITQERQPLVTEIAS